MAGVPIPEFIVELRKKVGHDRLWLTGVTAVLLDDQEQVLLTRRADSGRWALVSGILEPGEQPARAIIREITEETGVEAVVERLASVVSDPSFVLPNGDELQFLTLTFRCRYVSGDPRVMDDENLEVRWFGLDALPDLNDTTRQHLAAGLVAEGAPHYLRRGAPVTRADQPGMRPLGGRLPFGGRLEDDDVAEGYPRLLAIDQDHRPSARSNRHVGHQAFSSIAQDDERSLTGQLQSLRQVPETLHFSVEHHRSPHPSCDFISRVRARMLWSRARRVNRVRWGSGSASAGKAGDNTERLTRYSTDGGGTSALDSLGASRNCSRCMPQSARHAPEK